MKFQIIQVVPAGTHAVPPCLRPRFWWGLCWSCFTCVWEPQFRCWCFGWSPRCCVTQTWLLRLIPFSLMYYLWYLSRFVREPTMFFGDVLMSGIYGWSQSLGFLSGDLNESGGRSICVFDCLNRLVYNAFEGVKSVPKKRYHRVWSNTLNWALAISSSLTARFAQRWPQWHSSILDMTCMKEHCRSVL